MFWNEFIIYLLKYVYVFYNKMINYYSKNIYLRIFEICLWLYVVYVSICVVVYIMKLESFENVNLS